MRRRWSLTITIFVLLLAGSAPAVGGSPTPEVKAILDQAMEVQTRPALQGPEGRPERARLIREVIKMNFLSADMARISLQDHWEKLNPKQQAEFSDLFIDLFQDSYTRMVLNFMRKETIEYLDERPEKDRMRVQTKIMRLNEHIPVDYSVVERNGRWLVVDVTIDGVSIVGNYQNQFRRVIAAQSFDELMKKMRIQSQAIKEEPAS